MKKNKIRIGGEPQYIQEVSKTYILKVIKYAKNEVIYWQKFIKDMEDRIK